MAEYTYWVNDTRPPRILLRVDREHPGTCHLYRDGEWRADLGHSAYSRIVNGEGVDVIDEEGAMGVMRALDRRDGVRQKAVPPEREEVEQDVTEVISATFAELRDRLHRDAVAQ